MLPGMKKMNFLKFQYDVNGVGIKYTFNIHHVLGTLALVLLKMCYHGSWYIRSMKLKHGSTRNQAFSQMRGCAQKTLSSCLPGHL